ncbi:amino acid adenylation domain-containing protein [Lunatimonas lonarensis]|nr:non-ribosomal peptide synthetase [Lunatimonas lonarensis]
MKTTAVGFNPFAGNAIERVFPMIAPQKEIWLACMVGGEPANLAYNQAISLHMRGRLNVDRLRQSLAILIKGHQSLRSRISRNGESVMVNLDGKLEFEVLDFSVLPVDEQEDKISGFYQQNALRSFDLFEGPLIRFTLLKKREEDFVLNITAHHIICDGWSLNVIASELGKNYSLLQAGYPAGPNQEPDFSQYALQQLEFEKSPAYRLVQQYWQKKFAGHSRDISLPIDFPRPEIRTYRADRKVYLLSELAAVGIRNLVQDTGCSAVNVLLSGIEVMLSHACKTTEVVIGLPAAGQVVHGDFGLVGHCVNLLPIKSSVTAEKSFLTYLKQRRSELLDDLDHQRFTFGSLLESIQRVRDFSRVPLVPFVLNLDVDPGDDLNFQGLEATLSNDPRAYENFEIFLNVVGSASGFSFEWTYNADLFHPDTIGRLMSNLQQLLEKVCEDSSLLISSLGVGQMAVENTEVFSTFLPRDYALDQTFQQFFSDIVRRYPEHPAASFGSKEVDYQALDQITNQLANYLIGNGAGVGTVVGLAVDRSLEMLISVISIFKTGATYLPLDPEFPADRLSYMVENAKAQLVLVNEKHRLSISSSALSIDLESLFPLLANERTDNPGILVGPEDVAYILYTSGSTGRPKGVMVTHRNLTNLLQSLKEDFGLAVGDRWLAVSTISFDIAFNELLFPLVSGATVVVGDSQLVKDGRRLVEMIKEQEITVLQATPPTWRLMLLDEWNFHDRLRAVSTGEALPKDLAEKLLPKVRELWNGYGPTETTVWSSLAKITVLDRGVTIGKPIGNTTFYLLDTDGHPVRNGEPGELYIGGLGVSKGYLHLPELTAERFLHDPFSAHMGGRMYKTGDLVKGLSDGEFLCLGRLDNQVKIRGYRIELEEIEYALQKLDGIQQAVVGVREFGPGDDRLVAFIKPQIADAGLFEAFQNVWRKQLKEVLPPYMVPAGWVMMEEFPLTPNKKIDRAALPNPQKTLLTKPKDTAVLSPGEEQLVQIWSEVLGVSLISREDNFFELGGHSLTAVKVISRLEGVLGKKIPVVALFKYPVFGDFAANMLDEGLAPSSNSPTPTVPLVELPEMVDLTFDATEPQSEIFAACLLGGVEANKAYNLSFSLELKGSLNVPAFERALTYLQRHESLRARFSEDGTRVEVSADAKVPYQFSDVSGLEPEEIEAFIHQFKLDSVNQLFDLQVGPLARFSLIKTSERSHLFTIMVHHIVCDGWSIDNLFRELGHSYQKLIKGEPLSGALPPAYSRFASERQVYYQSDAYRETGNYWKEKFEDGFPVLELPTDQERLPNRSFNSKRLDFFVPTTYLFPSGNSAGFLGANTSTFLRIVLEVLLYKVSRQSDLITGMPVAGHLEHPDFFEMVGHCVNMLPVRAALSGDTSFQDYLARRKDEILLDFQHQGYTYGSMLKDLPISREASRPPMISFVMNFEKAEELGPLYTGLDVRLISNPRAYEHFEVVLNINEVSGGFWFNWSFQTALFSPVSIERWHKNFMEIAKEVASDSTVTLGKLPLIYDTGFRPARVGGPTKALKNGFLQILDEVVARFPDRHALSMGDEVLTYFELDRKSNQLARFLVEKGIRPNDRIGIYMDRSLEQMVVVLAILKAGATYVPLDISYPDERIYAILAHADLKMVFSRSRRSWKFEHGLVVSSDKIYSMAAGFEDAPLLERPNQEQMVYVLHTSGSTGQPKGVCMGYTALSNLIQWQLEGSGSSPEWSTVQFSPITFDVSFQEIFSTWCSGGTLVLISDEERLDAYRLLEILINRNINRLFQPFVALQSLCEAAVNRKACPVSLREVMTAGEQLQVTPQVVAFFQQLDGALLFNQYGPTETHVVTELRLEGDPANWPALPGIGKPIDNTTIILLDEQLNEVGLGQVGELCVAGLSLADRYLGSEQLTMDKFPIWTDHRGVEQRIYRTGDSAMVNWDGSLVFLGRKDDQVKIRGYRVELGEIEAVINSLPFVIQSVVKVQKNAVGQNELIAYIQSDRLDHPVRSDGSALLADFSVFDLPEKEAQLLRDALKSRLPDYMHPKVAVLVTGFKKTSSGKIDRKALPQVEVAELLVRGTAYFPPGTSNERLICQVWSKWLNLKEISIKDNFFELGGYSLIGIKIMAELEKLTGVRLPLISLFNNPTVEKLASLLEPDQDRIAWDSLVPIKPQGTKRPIYIVHGGGLNVTPYYKLVSRMDAEQPIYGIQAMGLNGIDQPFETIEEMASHYLSEILDQNPYGPYNLAGYSFGGVIAFEMAQQLVRMGKKVDKLILFDTYANQHERPTGLVGKVIDGIREELGKRYIEFNLLWRHPRVFKNKKVNSFRKKRAALMRILGTSQQTEADGILATQERIIAVNKKAALNYKAQKYDGSIYFFRAGIWDFYEKDLTYLGWRPFVNEIKVIPSLGEHVAMFNDENVDLLAKNLQQVLDE